MKNSVKVFIIALLLAMPALTFAQKPFKFGHLNKAEIFQVMPEKDSIKLKLDKFEKELNATLQGMSEEYQTKLKKYTDEGAGMDPLIKQAKEKELVQLQQNYTQYNDNATQLYGTRQNELMQPALEKLQKAINDVGKEGGFTYIFDLSAQGQPVAFFSSDSQDVTELVKQKLGIKAGAAKPAAAGKK